MAGRRYVILGDGAAGMTAVETLRRVDPACDLTVVSADPHPTYFRAALTNYLLGELRDDQLWAVPPTFFGELRAARVFGRATRVDTKAREVLLADGARVRYESLLVATGSRAREAPFEGATLPGVLTLRTLQDARSVMDLLAKAERAVVIGGGPLALEWAHALRERGLAVTLVARGDRLLPDVLDATASDLLLARLRRGGIDVHMGEEIASAWAAKTGRVGSVITRRGRVIEAGIVAVAIGVVCNNEALAGSAIGLGPHGGVAVDDAMRSSVADVFAAGDVAERGGRLLQLWEPARAMAKVAAANMAGAHEAFAPGAHYMATRLYDLDFAAVGDLDVHEGDTEIVDFPRGTGTIAYRKLVLRDRRVVGALLLGERSESVRARGRLYKRLIDGALDVSEIAARLFDPGLDLRGFLDRRALVERAPGDAKQVRPAEVRGTQRRTVPSAPAARLAPPLGGAAPTIARGPMGAPMLSIGLHVPDLAPAVPPEIPSARLESKSGRWELDREVATIGRQGSVTIDDPAVSLRHAEIVEYEGVRYLRDLGSLNGTRVNGARVTLPRALSDGDLVTVGATDLRFRTGLGRARAGAQGKPAATVTDDPRVAQQPRPRDSGALAQPLVGEQLELEVRQGAGVGLRFAIATVEAILGRDPASDVWLDEPSVSRQHARLTRDDRPGGRWRVTDMHASRGTTRNGVRLEPGIAIPLDDGDELGLGEVILVLRGSTPPR